MQPNKENIRKWVKALRSGEYKQGKSVLHRASGEMCCMGVICHLAAQEGIVSAPNLVNRYGSPVYEYDGHQLDLSESVKEWLGLEDSEPRIAGAFLGNHNDYQGKTFEEIADLIEKEYLSDEVAS